MRIFSTQIQDFSSRIWAFSCLFLLLKLPQSAGSSCLPSVITGFLSTINFSFLLHPLAQTDPEIFTPEPPNKDKGLSTRNDPAGRKANHLLPKPSALDGNQAVRPLQTSRSSPLPALAFSRHCMKISLPSPERKEHGCTHLAILKSLDSLKRGVAAATSPAKPVPGIPLRKHREKKRRYLPNDSSPKEREKHVEGKGAPNHKVVHPSPESGI